MPSTSASATKPKSEGASLRQPEALAENPRKMAAQLARLRACKPAAEGDFTVEEFGALCERYGDRCLRYYDRGDVMLSRRIASSRSLRKAASVSLTRALMR